MTSHGAYRFAAVALVLATLTIATPATAAEGPPASFFGMHYNNISGGSWPEQHVGSVRLWDTGTTWAEIQPERGMFDWHALDMAVENATRRGVTISLVLGITPRWASSQPDQFGDRAAGDQTGIYGPGSAAAPASTDDWWAYVHAVAQRYRGRIGSYELWNEPNTGGLFWTGSVAQMALLARVARAAVRSVDPDALLVSPGFVLRDTVGLKWAARYAKAGGPRWADVVAFHGYPGATVTPERAMPNVDRLRSLLARHGVRKPMWDTETNIEANTGQAHTMSPDEAAAQLVRYYLLSWDHGVRRVSWYGWGADEAVGVKLAAAPGSIEPSPAGQAFGRVQRWMHGDIRCHVGRRGAYSCRVARGVVRWSPTRELRGRAPVGSQWAHDISGRATRVHGGDRIVLDESPVMYRTR